MPLELLLIAYPWHHKRFLNPWRKKEHRMFDIKGYYEANELTDFYKLVRKRPQAKIIAGGTDVLIKSRQGNEEFVDTDLIGITNIRELHQVNLAEEKNLMIGGLNILSVIEEL